MKSERSKLLQPVLGRSMIRRAYDLAASISTEKPLFVLGHQIEPVKRDLEEYSADFEFCEQREARGTGDAVRVAMKWLEKNSSQDEQLFIFGGDTITIKPERLAELQQLHDKSKSVLSFITAELSDPRHYGRVLRSEAGVPVKIVEYKDASPEEKRIPEINVGFYLVAKSNLIRFLDNLKASEKTEEFYLTDMLEFFSSKAQLIQAHCLADVTEALGINSFWELAQVEEVLLSRWLKTLSESGVRFLKPDSQYIEDSVRIEAGVEIGPSCLLRGDTKIASGARIGSNCVIDSSSIAKGAQVLDFSHLEKARLGPDSRVGPYARLRPDSVLEGSARVGNFVELKNTRLEAGAKVNHLSYVGDAEIGENTNVGAGTITCNYDGFKKSKTLLGKNVFVGSNSSLVAPLKVGDSAIIGAGSVISKDVESGALAVERSEQVNRLGGADSFRNRRKEV